MMNRLKRIYQRFTSVNKENPWYGEPLEFILATVSFEEAVFLPKGGDRSISHYLTHLIQWRKFCLEKIQIGMKENIELNSEEDWPLTLPTTEEEWSDIKAQYGALTDKLLEVILGMEDIQLDETVPGKNYTYEFLLEGIIDHDLYHFGQISFLKRLAESVRD
ncbi:MAG: DinB family protein [Bacteroidota bacterium]